ncbi:MAG TPA: bifunctional 2-C-methyl-D-erythritol 4-phosphate cytidylyltransferase/2-C-methyl-D-erythritol 2,4-cyclodiphosphate synthase [Hyphomicrobiaceae bacterium]|nr:bifunctional 2-C-methyl-D-erythritol 4-phosphate cytidylyltransferase/2-C-methyl-D-erythritol 2,4-cyclodiphosphate synthase [Hyphomicrobiaceae bacterium]
MPISALIVAAGRGERAAASGAAQGPKQYAPVGGKALLAHAVDAYLRHPVIDSVLVVIHPDDRERYARAVGEPQAKLLAPCTGGETRQASVLEGLEALADRSPSRVLIHDAARPFVDAGTIDRVLAALDTHKAAIAAVPVADTLKRADASGVVSETIARAGLWRAQTPQGFHFAEILAAHRAAAAQARNDFTDDAAVAEWHGLTVALVAGSEHNSKITTAADLLMAQRALAMAGDVRTGMGFDVHRFAPGDAVWLCGVRIAHTHRLEGHSDADVGLHALTDALLGAIGDGDIGQHFPPSDERWRGAASHLFLDDARRRVAALGGTISNVDVTLLCEAPKIAPHRDAMRVRIAEILRIDASRVGVKATTTEGLGFTGRREGIAAMATATVILPASASP